MKKVVKLILLLVIMVLIFNFSAEPANDSVNTTNGFIDIIYATYNHIFGTKALSLDEFCLRFFKPIRKLAHFSEFAVLGLITYINSKEYFNKHNVLYSIIFSGLYAMSDEFHQLFVEGRYCSVIDMLIDTSGASLAILLMHFISKKCLKK